MLQTNLYAKELKATASLSGLLAVLGYQPEWQSSTELYYWSMLRKSDTKPAFAVNKEHNIWYDHGLCTGGNIIDFAMAYWKVTFREALRKLGECLPSDQLPEYGRLQTRRRHAQKVPCYHVDEVKPLGTNPEITAYLQSRGVYEVAQTLLAEVYYYIEDEKGLCKHFFAAGWKNELGAWEVYNPHFKGSLSYKAITFIERAPLAVAVFDDCLDYLSWQMDHPDAEESILILNSGNLLESAIRKIKDFLTISIYFDQDDTGRLKAAELIQALPRAVDRSGIYTGYHDYNDLLVKRIRRIVIRPKH